MDDPAEPDAPTTAAEKRAVLHQIAAYRELCKRVARSGTHALFLGGFMLLMWYLSFGQRNDYKLFSLLYLSVGLLEFAVGLTNRFRPSAEGVLFEGVVLIVFGLSTLARQYLLQQGIANNGRPNVIFALFGLYWIFAGVTHVRSYGVLRRQFVHRPSKAHLRWYDDLLRDIRRSVPETDPQALDLPTKPRIRGKLLGDLAILLVGGPDGLLVADRQAVEIDPEPSDEPGELPTAELIVYGQPLGRFVLHPENWRNYTAWKAETRP